MSPAAAETVADAIATHPYFPQTLLFPSHVPNTMQTPELLLRFALGSLAVLVPTHLLLGRISPGLSRGDRLAALWFALCGSIHFFFEGYFAWNHASMVSRTDIFGQLWKEYSLSDSRYMSQDGFTVCMEAVTALAWGPASYWLVYAIAAGHSMRHPVQLIVSVGQLYGDVLYYAICTFMDLKFGIVYTRPEWQYYWCYYILCNAFWIVIPAGLIWSSMKTASAAIQKSQVQQNGKKSQ